jgi:hypothetical protein
VRDLKSARSDSCSTRVRAEPDERDDAAKGAAERPPGAGLAVELEKPDEPSPGGFILDPPDVDELIYGEKPSPRPYAKFKLLAAAGFVSGCTPDGKLNRFRNALEYLGASPSGVARAHSLDVANPLKLELEVDDSPNAAGVALDLDAHAAPHLTRSGVYVLTFRLTHITLVVLAPLRACGASGSTFCPPRRVPAFAPGICDGRVAG